MSTKKSEELEEADHYVEDVQKLMSALSQNGYLYSRNLFPAKAKKVGDDGHTGIAAFYTGHVNAASSRYCPGDSEGTKILEWARRW